MGTKIDSFRFLSFTTQKLVRSWITKEKPRNIPWTPLSRPLKECTVALISTAGIALKTDQPFDQAGERKNPWWGDPSFRKIPRNATVNDVEVYHLHIDSFYVKQDLNCLLPLQRLLEFEESEIIGASAPTHYSFMGYILQPQILLDETTPRIKNHLKREGVDIVVLVPA